MPNKDGTGPSGEGPLTGRGLGPCGRGLGRGRGFGRGFCRWAGAGFGYAYGSPPAQKVQLTREEEMKILQAELSEIDAEKTEIQKRLKELEK